MKTKATKAAVAATAVLAAAPAAALAAPTINAAPNPTTTGDPVVIYGTATPGASVVLYHRVNPAPRFTPIQKTTADTAGRYEFTRADGVVTTNRNWFVKVNGEKSGTVHQKVAAIVSVTGPQSPNLIAGVKYQFSGKVTPDHGGRRVELQRSGDNDDWHTIDSARIGGDGSYLISHRFTNVGDANLRVHVDATRENVASDSDVLTDEVSQKQHAKLTINSSADPLTEGGTTNLTGQLAGVNVPTPVTLYAHVAGRGFSPVAEVNTDAQGNYAFDGQAPIANTVYQVRGGGRQSAQLFEGVHDAVTASVSSTSVTAGDTLTFTGSVAPDKTGHVVYLERKDADGSGWHVVQKSKVNAGSTIAIARRVVDPGTKVFRIFVPGGAVNLGGASAPLTVQVAANSAPIAAQ